MEVSTRVSRAEMQESIHLNRTTKSWAALIFGNLHLMLYSIAFLIGAGVAIGKAVSGHDPDLWRELLILIGILLFLAAIMYFKWSGNPSKTAKRINALNGTVRFESEGLHERLGSGASSFIPWTTVTRWKEGKRVFMVCTGRTFRTIAKAQMSEGDIVYLRAILQANVR